uniref:Uncharacterized protein n=1 Tax=Strigamia maritima TaxID=126957 RepID=T1JE78_STRMM
MLYRHFLVSWDGVYECRGHIYAVRGNDKDRNVECFDRNSGQWSSIDPLGTTQMAMTIGVLDGHVWVCGGLGHTPKNSKRSEVMDTMECLCPENNSWHYCPPLRYPRCFAAMTISLVICAFLVVLFGTRDAPDPKITGFRMPNFTEF